jgi:outer membrane immunogenic protein
MKKFLLAGVATVAIIAAAGPASAADLGMRPTYKATPIAAPVPVFSWTGCHVGAHAGWGWGRHNIKERTIESFSGGFHDLSAFSNTLDSSGAIFGGQVGCDYQFAGAWVLGVEGSFSAADINGHSEDPFGAPETDPEITGILRVKTDWITSLTGRLGFTGWVPQTMLYVKGGVAWAHERWETVLGFEAVSPNEISTLRDSTRTGWTIGVGAEWAFAPNWSAFVEWDHYDFGTKNLLDHSEDVASIDFVRGILDTTSRIETVRVGVNYRFNLFGFGKAPVQARY